MHCTKRYREYLRKILNDPGKIRNIQRSIFLGYPENGYPENVSACHWDKRTILYSRLVLLHLPQKFDEVPSHLNGRDKTKQIEWLKLQIHQTYQNIRPQQIPCQGIHLSGNPSKRSSPTYTLSWQLSWACKKRRKNEGWWHHGLLPR